MRSDWKELVGRVCVYHRPGFHVSPSIFTVLNYCAYHAGRRARLGYSLYYDRLDTDMARQRLPCGMPSCHTLVSVLVYCQCI